MTDKLIKRLLAAAAFQSRGDSDSAAVAFMEAASSEDLPKVIRAFLQGELNTRTTASAAKAKRETAAPSWPFRQTAEAVDATSEDEDALLDGDDVSAGLEEDFVDMGLTDAMDDAVLELSAAEEEDESDEDSEKEDASTVQSKAFARTLRNLHALNAAKKKKQVRKKKAVKKN